MNGMPSWASDVAIVDLHVHSHPSVLPRHHDDPDVVRIAKNFGITTVVLKAHEGCTAARAALAGAVGGIVLNASVGGANPTAVEMCAALGGRLVWCPTLSSIAHQQASRSSELTVHQGLRMPAVQLWNARGALLPEWHDVLDVVAENDMVLASGHLTVSEAVRLFKAAKAHGARRFLVNHPTMPFVAWDVGHAEPLRRLGAYLELGVLPDLVTDGFSSVELTKIYPTSLLAFGSDLGHAGFPDYDPALGDWLRRFAVVTGLGTLAEILSNGHTVLS